VALETSAEAPVPVRTVLQLVGGWIGKLGRVWVEGQIAECTRRGSTVFLTLRDPVAAVSAQVICSRLVFDVASPQVGARVVVWAKPDFNANRGSFALTALEIRAVGIGELLARLERLRRQLAAEGLFSAERKRPLPFLPGVIGLICGRESAAQRDVQENAERRWPAVRFRVEQTAVQGPYAVAEVIDALRKLDEDPDVDVIVIARGGGSVEDLLPFSDEALIRAVAACRTPVVSAIGHEQDTPLLDYVADLRASTPTDAAKRVVPDVAEQLALITQLRDRARRSVKGWLDRELAWLESIRSRPAIADPVREVERQAEQVDALLQRARMSLDGTLARAGDDIDHVRARLLALSPAGTLRRGYAIVQHADASVVRAAAEVTAGEKLTVRFAADQVTVHADGNDGGSARPGGDDPRPRSQGGPPGPTAREGQASRATPRRRASSASS
jgi:exodeoxyribonuclease VII large subunit